jgi:hypothetical protein
MERESRKSCGSKASLNRQAESGRKTSDPDHRDEAQTCVCIVCWYLSIVVAVPGTVHAYTNRLIFN